jgi:molybdate transport system substrate-binding protein
VHRRMALFGLSIGAVLLPIAAATTSVAAEKVVVFAAASLKNALDAVSQAWIAETKKDITISYAASSALARQIQDGAPAHVFISADIDWMDTLVDSNSVDPATVVKLLGNELVLIAPADSQATIGITAGFDLAGLLGDGKLAMGDVKAVPAGKYGKAALETLGAWASVESKIAMAENVRAALKFVGTGEAALGIVYKTDALAEPGVRVLGTFPANSHPDIIYPAGLVAGSQNADAVLFLAYLQGATARAIFEAQGFSVLAPPAN